MNNPWEEYERLKKELINNEMTPEQRDEIIKEIARRLGI